MRAQGYHLSIPCLCVYNTFACVRAETSKQNKKRYIIVTYIQIKAGNRAVLY